MSKYVATKLQTIAMVMARFCDNLYNPNSSSIKWKLFYELLNVDFGL